MDTPQDWTSQTDMYPRHFDGPRRIAQIISANRNAEEQESTRIQQEVTSNDMEFQRWRRQAETTQPSSTTTGGSSRGRALSRYIVVVKER